MFFYILFYTFYLYIIDFLYQLDFLFCNSAFEQGHLDTWRYKNALIIIMFTPSTRQTAPWISCKADYDWLNPRSLRTMSASDGFENVA